MQITHVNDKSSLFKVQKKKFSGYNIMASYYVSWMLAMPEDISILNLPFDKEFDIAKSMDQSGRK
jgi:hypothetical protein